MNVLLYLAAGGRSLPMPNLGLSVVASRVSDYASIEILDRSIDNASTGEGYDVSLKCHGDVFADAAYIVERSFDAIGLHVHTGNLLASALLLEELRRHKIHATIAVGGPSAHLAYRAFSRRMLADFFIFGNGAAAFRDIVVTGRLPPNALPADPDYAPKHAPYEQLPGVPSTPDFRTLYGRTFDMLPFLTTTGCIFNCSFCSSRRDVVGFRFTPSPRADLEAFLTQQRPHLIRFNDSSFNGHRPTFRHSLSVLMEAPAKTPWGAYVALASLREEEIPLMAHSGCAYVYIGIESGDARVRVGQKKLFTDTKAIRLTRALKNAGIMVLVSIIIGLPGETPETEQRTIDMVELLAPDAVHFFPYEDRHNLCALVGEAAYWTALLGRTTHRSLMPQNDAGYAEWIKTLGIVRRLKAYFSTRGIFTSESDLVRHLLHKDMVHA